MKTKKEIQRGDIYWYIPPRISDTESTSIQQKMRPVVIISNNACNKNSPILSGRYTTTQEKNNIPTHVSVYINNCENTILCEQEVAVVKSRLRHYIGSVDDFTMHQIERAILLQQDINPVDHIYNETDSTKEVKQIIESFDTDMPIDTDKSILENFCIYRENNNAQDTCIEYDLDIRTVDSIYANICKHIGRNKKELPSDIFGWKIYIPKISDKK